MCSYIIAPFISKIMEKAIATQIHSHLITNDIVHNLQAAYKAVHRCEKLYLECIMIWLLLLVELMILCLFYLIYLPLFIQLIDHNHLFCILEKYVGICGNARKLNRNIFLIVLYVFKLEMYCW